MEIWKDVVGYEGLYQVSNMGRIKSFHYDRVNGRVLKPGWAGCGYLKVGLWQDGKRKCMLVHRLVAIAFLGPPPSPDHEANHKNGDKTDNHVENLEWITHSGNTQHAYRILGAKPRRPSGEANGNAKLTDGKVRRIRKLYATGKWTQAELGKMFGVSDVTISYIVNRKIWKHIR